MARKWSWLAWVSPLALAVGANLVTGCATLSTREAVVCDDAKTPNCAPERQVIIQ